MVCGTASNVGKSHFVAGLCRRLSRRGVGVAPFKAQNMALNSFVTESGSEIGRAQGIQAIAAGVPAAAEMNPVLLKPTGERTCQVVVMGRPVGHMDAASYQQLKPSLLPVVLEALEDLRSRFDVVVCEGAGSPAEINLAGHDITNLKLAAIAGLPVIVVGDIDRGGVFASLYGTVALLEPRDRQLVRGFVINKLRGDPSLLGAAPSELERRCGIPTIGVLPYLRDVDLDAEDSLALEHRGHASPRAVEAGDATLDVAVVQLPRISNFTDVDPLRIEPAVEVRMVRDPREIGDADLVIVPGTKATVSDLDWLKATGFATALERCANDEGGPLLVGICGGYQMLGTAIVDDVESGRGCVSGLGLLDVRTQFHESKVVRQRRGIAMRQRVEGYEIHHGITERGHGAEPWVDLDDAYGAGPEGASSRGQRVLGTNLHGMLESDGFRQALLAAVAHRRAKRFSPSGACFTSARDSQLERLADTIEANVDTGMLDAIIAGAALQPEELDRGGVRQRVPQRETGSAR